MAEQVEGPAINLDWKRCAAHEEEKSIPMDKTQDLHAQLSVMLQSHKDLEDRGGMAWDLRCAGQTHKLHLIPFIVFFKADSVEGDKVSGQCLPKTDGVKVLCRHCVCPTQDMSFPHLTPEPAKKTQTMMVDLIKHGNLQGLQNISQKHVWNAFYRLQFGCHSDAGIHGATPWEVLHWIQLGYYKCDREAFFLQTGKTSTLSKKVDSLCEMHGQLLQRKSDRNLPRMSFTDGIRMGKLQAHEMSGVILLLALTLRSRAGRKLILETAWGDAKKLHFDDESHIRDWTRMLELELMFEQWLRKDVLQVAHLERAKSKVKEIMALRKHIGRRSAGMGHNTVNFHATIHLPQLSLDLCAPSNWDTQSDESHHRTDKKTARRTNMQESTFNTSTTAKKTVLREAIELGQQELAGITRWGCHCKDKDATPKPPHHFDPQTSGPHITHKLLPGSDEWVATVQSKGKGKAKICA